MTGPALHDDREREIVEQLAMAMHDRMERELGLRVEVGLPGRFDDQELRARMLPLRAMVLEFGDTLDDVAVVISSLNGDSLRPIATTASDAVIATVDGTGSVSTPQVHEFHEVEEAIESLEALYLEHSVSFSTPQGEVLVVYGSGLVAAVRRQLAGGPEAAAAPAAQPAHEYEPGLDDFVPPPGSAADAAVAAAPLAASLGTPEGVHAAALPQLADTAGANAAASSGSSQWATLLSGVDVEVSADLGTTSMRLGDVTSLVADAVLTLEQTIDDPVTVYVNGAPFAVARLVVVDDEYGIEILQVFARAGTPTSGAPDRRASHWPGAQAAQPAAAALPAAAAAQRSLAA